tara:strand:- start:231 stop:416 length:186 start_codon:yes stop_codon:yes gene_type:complete
MTTRVESDQPNVSVTVSKYDDGVWISIHRHCAYASASLTRAQAEQLRDGINILLETADAAQ